MRPPRRPRRPDPSSKLILQEIIGLTVSNANGLASNASSKYCVYVAGCVAVLYDIESGARSHLVASRRAPKALSCVTVSIDGRFVAAAESGNHPSVLIWESASQTLVSELKDHLYGVACIAFSSDGKHLVSVGGYIYLWDWQGGQLVAKLKASSSCNSIASVTFSLDGKHIITAGNKHLKLWSVGFSPRTRFKRETDNVVIQGKPINLGPEKGNTFVSVTSPIPNNHQLFHIYALTEAGTLCLMQSGSIIKTVDLKVEKGFALSTSEELVACACSNGLVKLVSVGELACAGVLSYSEQSHYHKDDCCSKSNEMDFRHGLILPDAVACQFLHSEKIAVIYGDHSFYIWDIHDTNKATRCCMLVSHATSIWDIKNLCCENLHNPAVACTARGCSSGTSFATCSADGTIRLWDFLSQPELSVDAAYSQSADSKLVGTRNLVSSGIFERDTIEPGTGIVNGFRSLAVSSDGEYLAAGDCKGNLHIYNLQTSDYMCLEGAHDAEILSLEFNLFNDAVSGGRDYNHLLTSGGRDRIIHVYDVKRNFNLVSSIVEHSAAVTSVKLTPDGHKLVSCSADRSLVVRDVFETEGNFNISRCHHQMASSGTVYDMVLDPSSNVAVTVGQDKKISTFDIASGQLMRSFKPNKDYGDPIKVTVDPSCSYLVCSYSNKSMCIYDFISGEMVSQAMGHSEVITGVIFLPDCRHIVSVGGDGCIFVWKLPNHVSSRILQAITKSGPLALGSFDLPEAFTRIIKFDEEQLGTDNGEMLLCNFNQTGAMSCLEEGCQGNSNFKFRVSLLPKWAQTKVVDTRSSEVIPSQLLRVSSGFQPYRFIKRSGFNNCPLFLVLFQDVETPSKTDPGENGESRVTGESGISGPDGYETSPSTQNNSNGSVADNHWLTVYTVFMDNSPAAWGSKDEKILVSSPCGSMQKRNGECSVTRDYKLHEKSKKCETQETAIISQDNCEEGENIDCSNHYQAPAQSHADQMENEVPERTDVHTACTNLEENDLFKEHFGSLSAAHKIESRDSSSRKRYSSRFVVRRNYVGDRKKITDSPGQDSVLEDSAVKFLKKLETKENCHRPLENSTGNLMGVCTREGKLQEKIDECSNALISLENAAKTTSRLFSEILTLVSEDESLMGPATRLLDQAANSLPSISEKVNELTTSVQVSGKNSSGRPHDKASI